MPHKCTKCEHLFEDGSSVILHGCPHCGGNKFFYVKEVTAENTRVSKPDEQIVSPLLGEQIPVKPKRERKADPVKVESIKIVGPGSYEINIPALIERKEIVMALKEEGRYVIHMPSAFNRKNIRFKPEQEEK